MDEKLSYLIECFKSAREELLFRVKHRDMWLKIQLLTQVILWGLANNIKISGVESNTSFPSILLLSLPVSIILAGLYFIEDGLINNLSLYLSGLSKFETKINEIPCWDSSSEFKKYLNGYTLILRSLTQLFIFLIIPLFLLYDYNKILKIDFKSWQSIIFKILSLIIILFIIFGYINRRKNKK